MEGLASYIIRDDILDSDIFDLFIMREGDCRVYIAQFTYEEIYLGTDFIDKLIKKMGGSQC